MFETAGAVEDFLDAARRIGGFDFMAEWDEEDIAPSAEFFYEADPDAALSGRVYLVMSNQQALQQLLGLWTRFTRGQRLPWGFARFAALFEHLRDVRIWGVEDRLRETGVLEYWAQAAAAADETSVPFQIELWFRDSPEARRRAAEHVRGIVESLGGRVEQVFELAPICYQVAVATLPAAQIRRLVDGTGVELLADNTVMFFRPSGQSVAPPAGEIAVDASADLAPAALPAGEPTVALLDGLPVENHARLAGRLRVDDPDGYGALHPANEREHGTAMASIIAHGDLNTRNSPFPHPLYVRPIMRPDPQPWDGSRTERVPHVENELDLTHRAMVRMLRGEQGAPPTAPAVRVVSFSIGDPLQQFNNAVSAWGRLLDWLAVEFNVLFCVSAGNHPRELELDVPRAAFGALAPLDKETAVLAALRRDLRWRRILAPSDSINGLTVGSWHADSGGVAPVPHRFDPYVSQLLPSPLNGLGGGLRNSVKPEVLLPGGRQFYQERLGNVHLNATLDINPAILAPGVRVASPGRLAGEVDREKHTRGTSNSTALAARSAGFLLDQFLALRNEPGGDQLRDEFMPVLLKAALVHRGSWRGSDDLLRAAMKPAGMREDAFKRLACRFLGFGFVDPIEAITGDDHRATLLGCGELNDGRAHEYQIPLPPSLSGTRSWRRVTVTLAWFSPINPRHRNYRRAALWFDIEREKLAVERHDVDWRSARNGTIQHEVFDGERAAAYGDGERMIIRVNCRADAGALDTAVRYALFFTVEVAEGQEIAVYDEIAARVRPQVRVQPG